MTIANVDGVFLSGPKRVPAKGGRFCFCCSPGPGYATVPAASPRPSDILQDVFFFFFFFSVILSIATMAESRPALGKGTTKHLARTDAEMDLTIFALVCTARRSVNASFNCVLLR